MSDEVTPADFKQTMQVLAERLGSKPDAYSMVLAIERLKQNSRHSKKVKHRRPTTTDR